MLDQKLFVLCMANQFIRQMSHQHIGCTHNKLYISAGFCSFSVIVWDILNVKKIFMCQNDTKAMIQMTNKPLSRKCIYFLYAITQRIWGIPHPLKRHEWFNTSVAKYCCISVFYFQHMVFVSIQTFQTVIKSHAFKYRRTSTHGLSTWIIDKVFCSLKYGLLH